VHWFLFFGLPNGNILLASTSLSEQSAPVATTQTLNTDGATQSLDQLQTQLHALHQRNISTQKAIEQLTLEDAGSGYHGFLSDDPWMMGSEVFVLGLGALLVGWLLGLLTSRRSVLVAPAPAPASAPAPSRFADRQMIFRDTEIIATPAVVDKQREPLADPVAEQPIVQLPSVFNQMDFDQSALMLDSASVLGLFEDLAPVPSSQTAAPSLLHAGVDSRAPAAAHGFDSAAAANEVERVRKSLAQKRDERSRQREFEASARSALQPMGWSSGGLQDVVWDRGAYPEMQGEAFDEPFGGVDLLLDLPDEFAVKTNTTASDAGVACVEVPAIVESQALTFELSDEESDNPVAEDQLAAPDVHLLLTPLDTPVAPEPEPEPEPELEVLSEVIAKEAQGPDAHADAVVQLELALEFEALRLLDGAREIAQEVLESNDDELRLKAEALMARLAAIETVQHADALVDDAL